MPIAVICPSCGYRAGAKEEWIGREVKCPGCGERIMVEGAAPREPPTRPAPQRRLAAQPRLSARTRQTERLTPRSAGMARNQGGVGKTVWIAAGTVGGLLLLVGVGVIASGALSRSSPAPTTLVVSGTTIMGATPAAELPAWSPDSALLNQLESAVSFDRYSLRLPSGYEPLDLTAARRAPPGVQRQTWAWCDKPAADGTRHVIQASVASASDIPHTNDLDAEVNAYLQNARTDAGSAKFEPGTTAKGQVCGGPFARLTYSVATPEATVHAISYLGFDGGNRMLTLICACKEAEGTEASKLLETSLLSLKRN